MVQFSVIFFFKRKTAYERRMSDWSSDVCSSDLFAHRRGLASDLRVPRTRVPSVQASRSGPSLSDGHAHCLTEVSAYVPAVQERNRQVRRLVPWRKSEERRVGKECVSTFRSRR